VEPGGAARPSGQPCHGGFDVEKVATEDVMLAQKSSISSSSAPSVVCRGFFPAGNMEAVALHRTTAAHPHSCRCSAAQLTSQLGERLSKNELAILWPSIE